MTTEEIQALIQQHIENAEASVSGSDGKYTATVISNYFTDLDMVSRHQAVYGAVKEHIASGALHALSINAYTPDEYEKMDGKLNN